MSEQMNVRSSGDAAVDYSAPVPAARPMHEFSTERIGDNLVLFDVVLNRYHTLNAAACDIWRLCDGVRTASDITRELDANREAVEAAIEQLGESGLLQAPETSFESTIHRRTVVKLAAAGVLGALALPVIQSISVPDAAAAASKACTATSQCNSNQCCCVNGGHPEGTCRGISACNGPGDGCLA